MAVDSVSKWMSRTVSARILFFISIATLSKIKDDANDDDES